MNILLPGVTVLVSVCILLLFVPFSYTLQGHLGHPRTLTCRATWFMKHVSRTYPRTTEKEMPPESPSAAGEALWKQLREETNAAAEKPAAPSEDADFITTASPFPSYFRFLLDPEVLTDCLAGILRILTASQLTACTLSGCLGLPRPHQTGILAAVLYSLGARQTENLRFTYTESSCDCTLYIAGKLYPAQLLYIVLHTVLQPPVRTLLKNLWDAGKEKKHG